MMRRIMMGVALLGAISLGACSSTQVAQVDTELAAAVTQAEAVTLELCSFQPTEATVMGVIAALFPGGAAINAVAQGVAQDICAAVAPAPVVAQLRRVRRGAAPLPAYVPEVDPKTGVVIQGKFVAK